MILSNDSIPVVKQPGRCSVRQESKTSVPEEESLYQTVLRKEGYVVVPVQGNSMFPLIHPETDAVILVPVIPDNLKPMDVVLYIRKEPEGGRIIYVLHRILKVSDDTCLLSGDHCLYTENVKTNLIIGRMTGYFRQERRVSLESVPYQLYVWIWCRPWRLRILVLDFGRHICMVLRKVFRRTKKETDQTISSGKDTGEVA